MKRIKTVFSPLISYIFGLIAALPLCFDGIGVLIFGSFIPFLYTVFADIGGIGNREVKKRHPYLSSYGRGLLFFLGYYMGAYFWFWSMYPLDFAGFNEGEALAVILLAWIGLPLMQAAFYALMMPLFLLITRKSGKSVYAVICFSALFVIFGYFQTLTWAGVPFAPPAVALYRARIFLQGASLFGSLFVDFLIITVNALIARAAVSFRQEFDLDRAGRLIVGALAVFILNTAFGGIVMLAPENTDTPVKITVLQGNISSTDRHSLADSPLDVYCDMAIEAAELHSPDIIVMPETTLVNTIRRGSYYERVFTSLAERTGAEILVSAFYDDKENDKYHTSIYLFSPDTGMSEIVYSKQKLVPFGEFVPMKELIEAIAPPLAELTLGVQEIDAGNSSRPLPSKLGGIGGQLCFDTVYAPITRGEVSEGAELIVVGSNDSWFGDSRAIYIHHAHSVLRAIEGGRSFAVSASTGISAIITNEGEILGETLPLERASVTDTVYMQSERTLYSVIGDSFVIICAVYVLLYPFADKLSMLAKKVLGKENKTVANN